MPWFDFDVTGFFVVVGGGFPVVGTAVLEGVEDDGGVIVVVVVDCGVFATVVD